MRLTSWHARTLAYWEAASIQVDPKKTKKYPAEIAQESTFFDTEDREEWEWVYGKTDSREKVQAEPEAGSYEAIMAVFGSRMSH